MKEVKSYLCADLNAQSYNHEIFGQEIKKSKNPYLEYLYHRQHPFFKIIKGEELNNRGKDPFLLFTFLHQKDPHNIYLNIVVESVNINKATMIFTTRFRANRFQYNNMLNAVLEYFSNKVKNKRSRLIDSKLICSSKPCFTLYFSRIYHIQETWFSLIKDRLFLEWEIAYGILHDLMINGQELEEKYFDGTEN